MSHEESYQTMEGNAGQDLGECISRIENTRDVLDGNIPKGTPVGISPIHTHHMPSLWTKPNEFDPERFSPDRAEHKRHQYGYLPFGGGAHLCIGQHFADMEVKSVVHQVLRRVRLSVPEGYRMPYQLVPIAKPKDGLPMTLQAL